MPQPTTGILYDLIQHHEARLKALVLTANAENNYVPEAAKAQAEIDAAQHRAYLKTLYAVAAELNARPVWRHRKRGSIYSKVGSAIVQAETPLQDGDITTLYQGVDGKWFVRPPTEFEDGRFEPLEAPAGFGHGDALHAWMISQGIKT